MTSAPGFHLRHQSPQRRRRKLVLICTPIQMRRMYCLPMFPMVAFPTDKQEKNAYQWWVNFSQVKGLPEQLLPGLMRYVHDYVFKHVSEDEGSIGEFNHGVYAARTESALSKLRCTHIRPPIPAIQALSRITLTMLNYKVNMEMLLSCEITSISSQATVPLLSINNAVALPSENTWYS